MADFARLESETSTEEAMEAEEYNNFMFEPEIVKQNEMKHKTETKTSKESALLLHRKN